MLHSFMKYALNDYSKSLCLYSCGSPKTGDLEGSREYEKRVCAMDDYHEGLIPL